jgi:hypothetical protein
MKRTAAAGTFALLAGGATLLLVASILYSCRGGARPHDMGTGSTDAPPSQSEAAASMETVAPRVTDVASRVSLDSPFSKRL